MQLLLQVVAHSRKGVHLVQPRARYIVETMSALIPTIVCVGSCNIDLMAYMSTFPAVGETVHGTSFERGFGGKGANQAVAAALLGEGGAAMVGALGDDAFGTDTLQHFRLLGISTEYIRIYAGVASGVAPIWVNAKGDNCIVIVSGANSLITPHTAVTALAAPALESCRALLCQLEIPLETTAAALAAGRARGAVTFLTPAPAPPHPLPAAMLSTVSVLVPNETEARALAGFATPSDSDAGQRPSLIALARSLLQMSVGAVVVTLGARGALVVVRGDDADASMQASGVLVPAAMPSGPVIDTTGAGDAFTGALAYFYTTVLGGEGGDGTHAINSTLLVEAVRRAAYYAADSVTKRGTQRSYAARGSLPDALFDAGVIAASEELRLPTPRAWSPADESD